MKIINTKAELVDLVLEKMRSYEGCEELQDIRIEIDQKGAWFIAPCDLTARFSERAERAALTAQAALREKYGVDVRHA